MDFCMNRSLFDRDGLQPWVRVRRYVYRASMRPFACSQEKRRRLIKLSKRNGDGLCVF